jgi:hypothetical protein
VHELELDADELGALEDLVDGALRRDVALGDCDRLLADFAPPRGILTGREGAVQRGGNLRRELLEAQTVPEGNLRGARGSRGERKGRGRERSDPGVWARAAVATDSGTSRTIEGAATTTTTTTTTTTPPRHPPAGWARPTHLEDFVARA